MVFSKRRQDEKAVGNSFSQKKDTVTQTMSKKALQFHKNVIHLEFWNF